MASSFVRWAHGMVARFVALEDRLDRMQRALGRVEAHLQHLRGLDALADREMQVTSQWGEDGVVRALAESVPLGRRRFVEFGVEDYRESNTRFLLAEGGWSGLVMDGSAAHIDAIVADTLSWRQDLVARRAFITRDNLDDLLRSTGFDGDLDLLSIDVDGNDYWLWEAMRAASPRIVIVEYNSVFGPDLRCSVPYRADFQRNRAHHSNLYYGASAAAMEHLGTRLGYRLVHGNRAGNNLFFVREDVAGALPRRTAAEAWALSRFREARDERGGLLLTRADQARTAIAHLPVVDIDTGHELALSTLLARRTG